uniref:Estradiol 17-beta-dehydrogenase n=1 Tax=Ornithorhynchus anatinus TaxID=9258 RepID=A0A6I8N900_ORNAN
MARTVVLITGCSSGIGLHLALRLAAHPSRSFKVYAALRDPAAQGPLWEGARARGCPPGSLQTLPLDVTDPGSVAAAKAAVSEGRVDVLVCNAGRGLVGPLEAQTTGAARQVLDVNVLGSVHLLQAFLPDMKRRRAGRVLVTGSIGGLQGIPFNAVYCASQFALEGLCESLAVLLLPFDVHLSLIERGGPGGVLGDADPETRALFARYLQHSERLFREAAQEPEEVVEVFLAALRAPRPALRYYSTERFLPLARQRLEDPSGSRYVAAMHRFVFEEEPGAGGLSPLEP